jgi:hypothetical protein
MQRSIGLAVITGGSLATIGAMFLPVYDYAEGGGLSLSWWEVFSGLDVAVAVAAGIAAILALIALVTRNRVVTQLSIIAGAMVFGLAFAFVAEVLDDTEGVRAGFWIVGGAGAMTLAGAVAVSLSKS